jgi:hypothetical protein
VTNPPLPSRAEVRATAKRLADQIRAAAQRGENAHQLKFDLLDEQDRYSKQFGPQSDEYLDLLSQEIEAITQFEAERDAKVAQEQLGSSAQLAGVAFGLIIGIPLLMMMCH